MIATLALLMGMMSATPVGEPYVACGCGCCGGVEPKSEVQCVVDQAALDEVIRKDKEAATNPQCAMMGCSIGTIYQVCE